MAVSHEICLGARTTISRARIKLILMLSSEPGVASRAKVATWASFSVSSLEGLAQCCLIDQRHGPRTVPLSSKSTSLEFLSGKRPRLKQVSTAKRKPGGPMVQVPGTSKARSAWPHARTARPAVWFTQRCVGSRSEKFPDAESRSGTWNRPHRAWLGINAYEKGLHMFPGLNPETTISWADRERN